MSEHANEHRGKTVFITGGTSGINLGIAKGFAREGAKVAVIGRDPDRAANAEAEIKAECTGDGDAMGFSCDVRDYDAVDAALKKAADAYGSIDVLVAGAAGNFYAPLLGMSPNAFRTVVDIDLFGTFNAFRASYPYLTKPGASLIAISAGQADRASAMQAHACAAKAGVNQLTKVCAVEWGPAGVRANIISPGGIADTVGVQFLSKDPAKFDEAINRIPGKRLGTVDEIADAAKFLSSDAARYINGQVIYVDGGLYAGDASTDCLNPPPRK
jgi:NAD(P)-dependent dehydrogenase (short-subunit alcohol dehydrogenase family)